jgi:hypothetical protein
MIGLLAVAIGVLVYWQHNDEVVDSAIYSDVNSSAVHAAEDVYATPFQRLSRHELTRLL